MQYIYVYELQYGFLSYGEECVCVCVCVHVCRGELVCLQVYVTAGPYDPRSRGFHGIIFSFDLREWGGQVLQVLSVPHPSDEWKSRNGQILWSPTNSETLHYVPATGVIPGPTRYTIACVTTIKSCFDLFFYRDHSAPSAWWVPTCTLTTSWHALRVWGLTSWQRQIAHDIYAYMWAFIWVFMGLKSAFCLHLSLVSSARSGSLWWVKLFFLQSIILKHRRSGSIILPFFLTRAKTSLWTSSSSRSEAAALSDSVCQANQPSTG